ncbi:MAG: bifunctional DNA-formamidopyrimidine glycosylase/DNA-(apurinic or apyrimidinic site) lyase [Acidobacteria bacterium]|nr:bifunctional DNA-formamidopyrimidine glycosylase/DNA-(apurinic or apyrimidinic site) lyase [Acidobacteriota bacterium]
MPELPEVETVVRGLRALLPGRRIVSVRLGKTDFMDDPGALAAGLPGTRIAEVRRHGKFIVMRLEVPRNADADSHLIVHLGMTGQLVVQRAGEPAAAHTHAFFALDDGRELRYTDPRRFGRIALFSEKQFASTLARLGADPLEVSEAAFCCLLAGRRARIKALLLDQRFLRGMGNIYADESLWRAKLHPARQAARLRSGDIHRLLEAMRHILNEAIRLRGSSVSDYVDANGERGEYQLRHRVYDRQGKSCFRCGATIRRILVAGRSSYFCPRCQPAPRARPEKKSATHHLRELRVEVEPPYSKASEQLPRSRTPDRLQPMTFWQAIRDLRRRGKIARQWRASDLMPHLSETFSPRTIRTVPANQSVSRDGKVKGDYVKRGREAQAFRVGDGLYELIDDPS